MNSPLVKTIWIRCSAEHAFRVWTRHTSVNLGYESTSDLATAQKA